AGQGTRMKSRLPKVLHPLGGRPLIRRVLQLLQDAGADRVVVVLGHEAEQVRRYLPESVHVVVQEQQLGTGHAVQIAAPKLRQLGATRMLVHLGDAALVRPDTLRRLIEVDVSATSPIALLSARVANPQGYGRVIRLVDG